MKTFNNSRKYIALWVALLFIMTLGLSACNRKEGTQEHPVISEAEFGNTAGNNAIGTEGFDGGNVGAGKKNDPGGRVDGDDPLGTSGGSRHPVVGKQPAEEKKPEEGRTPIGTSGPNVEDYDDPFNTESGSAPFERDENKAPKPKDTPKDNYAQMPGAYGASRNIYDFTRSDARGVTQDNFLKLRTGMSSAEVKEILSDAEFSVTNKIDNFEYWAFESEPTIIKVDMNNGILDHATYLDYFRLCVTKSDFSIDTYLKLKQGISFDDVVTILGDNYFKKSITTPSYFLPEATELNWFSEEGEIRIYFNENGRVLAFAQSGLQYLPDSRFKYDVLSDAQILANYNTVPLDIEYPKLLELMGNYIPLINTLTNGSGAEVSDRYMFSRYNEKDNLFSIDFNFRDGKLCETNIITIPKPLVPKINLSDAKKVAEGMSYDDVKGILGEGVKTRHKVTKDRDFDEEYIWHVPDEKNPGYYDTVIISIYDGYVGHILLPDELEW